MSKPFDAATKALIEKYPLDWLRELRVRHVGRIVAVSADLSTITTEADRVFLVKARTPWILHLEIQSSADAELPERMLSYNGLLHRKFKLPVHSAVILLRPAADHPACTGKLRYRVEAAGRMDFAYQVVRVWKQSARHFLERGLGTLPLAPLAQASEDQMPGIIASMDERIRRGRMPQREAGSLWTATFILMGLRFESAVARGLLKGVMGMKESTTYQAIVAEGLRKGIKKGIEKGHQDEARRMTLSLGAEAFGPPSARVVDKLNSITSTRRLEALAKRILTAKSWDELLA